MIVVGSQVDHVLLIMLWLLAKVVSGFAEVIDASGLLSLTFLAGLLFYLGRKIAGHRRRLVNWGSRFGGFVGVAFVVRTLFLQSPFSASDLSTATIRGALVGCVSAGACWIALAGLTIVLGLPLRLLLGVLTRSIRVLRWRPKPTPCPIERPTVDDSVRTDPRKEKVKSVQEAARMEVDLLYERFAQDCSHRFGRERYEALKKQYLNDDHDLATFSNRIEQLQRLIRELAERAKPELGFASLEELTKWYERKRSSLKSLPMEDVYKESLLIELNDQFSVLADQLVRRPQ